jgi:ACS family tartrate transporter-like MFS transporter
LTALVHTPTQLYLARFVLGGAEAGFFPGVIVYLSHWFVHEDRAKATSSFMAAAPLSLIIGSPIAGWILGHSWLAIEGWRWLFLLEGLPAVVLGIAAFFFLTDWPREATWLAAEQQQWLQQKLDAERLPIRQSVTLGQALRSRAVCLLTAAAFLEYFVGYAVVFWLPTVLKRLSGFSDLQVGLLGSVPYIVALAAMLINGWHSDKTRERRWHAAIPLFISAVGLLCLITLPGPKLTIVFWFSLTSVCMAFLPAFWAIPTDLLSASTAAVTVGMINAVASIAGFAGPYAFGYLHNRTGTPSAGFGVLVFSALAAALLMLLTPTATRPRAF